MRTPCADMRANLVCHKTLFFVPIFSGNSVPFLILASLTSARPHISGHTRPPAHPNPEAHPGRRPRSPENTQREGWRENGGPTALQGEARYGDKREGMSLHQMIYFPLHFTHTCNPRSIPWCISLNHSYPPTIPVTPAVYPGVYH